MNKVSIKNYNDYSTYIRNLFGERVQKISLNVGYSCPNRDGTKGIGGCTYCNISSIKPAYAKATKSISKQLEEGISFFSKKYDSQNYIAYFQSYTNTYNDKSTLIKAYEEALSFPGIIGLVVATRPDCIDREVVTILKEFSKSKYVSVELGIESTNEQTLKKINRCHTFQDTINAIELLASAKIKTGGHLILGFPWETKEDVLRHAKNISSLPINYLKLHHLQILKFTQMAKDYFANENDFRFLNVDQYLDLIIEFLMHLNPEIVVQRFISESPSHLLIAPLWNGIKNFEFTQKIDTKMKERGVFQGTFYKI